MLDGSATNYKRASHFRMIIRSMARTHAVRYRFHRDTTCCLWRRAVGARKLTEHTAASAPFSLRQFGTCGRGCDTVIAEHIVALEEKLMGVAANPKEYSGTKSVRSKRTMRTSAQFLMGRTIGRGAVPPEHYQRHNFKDEIVFMRDPRVGGKPQWQKDLWDSHLVPLIELVAPEWAGGHEDFAVQVSIYSDGSYCHSHRDEHDIDVQYGLGLGNYTGGALQMTSADGVAIDLDIRHRIVKMDARNSHKVLPFQGTRISIFWYKRYDRRMGSAAPVSDSFEIVWDPSVQERKVVQLL